MNKIKIGSKVVLRSGGPLMIVESFAETGRVIGIKSQERANCQWYDGVELLHGTFRISSLITPTDL